MMVCSFLCDVCKLIVFVLVYIGYEKVIEGGFYIGELYGGKKKKEFVGGLMKFFKVLCSYFGQVYVNFGELIKLVDYLDSYWEGWCNEELLVYEILDWFKIIINNLGCDVVIGINVVVVVNLVNLISLVLLVMFKYIMDLQ